MEKLIMNPYDKEYMKMAILKHEETFRDQVNELHRLYRIQKILMKNVAKSNIIGSECHYVITQQCNKPEARKCLELENRAEEFNHNIIITEGAGDQNCSRVLESEDDQNDQLELTLGPRSYYQRKIKASQEPAANNVITQDHFGPSFSSSSRGSINHIKRARNSISSQQKWPGNMEMISSVSSQERLDNNPHWLFQVLSLNMT